MTFYAETGPRRTRQLVVDAITGGWCILWILIGIYVTSRFSGAENGAKKLQSSGASLSQHLSSVGDTMSGLPMVGGAIKTPIDRAATAATSLGNAGHDLSDGLGRLAFLLGFLTALTPMFVALLPWSLVRVRYARRAGRVVRLRALPNGEKLLALEALTSASPRALEALSADPAGDWQKGDPAVTRALADVALSSYGLRHRSTQEAGRPKVARGETQVRVPDENRQGRATAGERASRPARQAVGRRNDTENEDTHWA